MTNPYKPAANPSLNQNCSTVAASSRLRRIFSLTNFALLIGIAILFEILRAEGQLLTLTIAIVILAVGLVAHGVYAQWVHTRVTVPVIVILLLNSMLVGMMASSNAAGIDWSLLLEIPLTIPKSIRLGADVFQNIFLIVASSCAILMTAAHSIRPGWRTAMLTSIGLGIWYSASLVIMGSAG